MRRALLLLPALVPLAGWAVLPEGPDPQQVERGRATFETVCVGCHTLAPPPDSAPPMSHVVRHLRRELTELDAFTEHVRTYVAAPAQERSRMPAMAVERFGLMQPLPLGDSILTDVAAYLWTLGEEAAAGSRGMGAMGGDHGQGGPGMQCGRMGGEGGMKGHGGGMGGMKEHGGAGCPCHGGGEPG